MVTFQTFLDRSAQESQSSHGQGRRTNSASRPPAVQTDFQDMLRLERRRTERSGRQFLLLLISNEESDEATDHHLSDTVAPALAMCIRETDVLGWYEEPRCLGVLITEVGEIAGDMVETILQKISAALERSLPLESYRQLVLVARLFPSDGEDRVFYPDLSHRNYRTKVDHIVKRGIDILGSLAALIIFSPAMLAIAIGIKCSSPGPVFFWQKRIGRHGKEFSFYKFRTMLANNDPRAHREYIAKLIAGTTDATASGGLYKLANDPRVTPLGRILRRSSLDELPQFFNVLLDDMSLVGPRPPLPYEYEKYRAWHRRRVLELKPGITGIWQIEGRSRTTFDEMVRMDIRYSKIRTTWLDIKIMLQTPSAMFFGRGAC